VSRTCQHAVLYVVSGSARHEFVPCLFCERDAALSLLTSALAEYHAEYGELIGESEHWSFEARRLLGEFPPPAAPIR
jgi:hypothetical protein